MPTTSTAKKRPVRRKLPRGPRRLSRSKSVGSLFVTALDFTDTEAATILRRMLIIRRLDEALIRLARRNGAPVPPAPGREAIALGVCSVLRPGDVVLADEWRHGLIIARSGSVRAAIKEWRPQAGTAAADAVALPVLNGGMAVAVGSALACRWNKDGQAAVCFCSPGESATGTFHESLTLAASWKLPVVFIFPEFEAGRGAGSTRIFTRARQYGVEGVLCDGSSVADVRAAVKSACERARSGKGPTLIEAALPVAKALAPVAAPIPSPPAGKEGDASPPADAELSPPVEGEADIKSLRDPIRIFRNLLAEAALIEDATVATLEREAALEVKTALASAGKDSAIPAREILLRNVYKGWIEGRFGLMRDGQ